MSKIIGLVGYTLLAIGAGTWLFYGINLLIAILSYVFQETVPELSYVLELCRGMIIGLGICLAGCALAGMAIFMKLAQQPTMGDRKWPK